MTVCTVFALDGGQGRPSLRPSWRNSWRTLSSSPGMLFSWTCGKHTTPWTARGTRTSWWHMGWALTP
eukprot:985009-Ditylum_brightwellii.AAC.1